MQGKVNSGEELEAKPEELENPNNQELISKTEPAVNAIKEKAGKDFCRENFCRGDKAARNKFAIKVMKLPEAEKLQGKVNSGEEL